MRPSQYIPFDPKNNQVAGNRYCPMWNTHLNSWAIEAINGPNRDKRRSISGYDDLEQLIDAGLVTSFAGSPCDQ